MSLSVLLSLPAAAAELCLVGGEVLDPDRRTVTTADVIVADDKITKIGAGAGKDCRGRRIDVGGQVVMPALVDAHVHGWGNPSPTDEGEEDLGREAVLALVLRAGVMATLDLAGDDERRIALRDRLRGSPGHARLLVGAMIVARPGPAPAELAKAVRARAARRPDVIKILSAGGPVAPIVAEARRLRLPTVVHINDWGEARAAVAAGASAVTHFEDEVQIPADLLAAWAARRPRIWSIPTMAVQCDLARVAGGQAPLDDPLLLALTTPALRAAYRDQAAYSRRARHWVRWQSDGCVANDFVSLRALARAGVPILAGADTGNLGTFQGYSLHRELELMVEAGLPAWEALRAATSGPVAFLGLGWRLAPGAPANLIVLAGSPLRDIRNTRRLVHVIHRGALVGAAP